MRGTQVILRSRRGLGVGRNFATHGDEADCREHRQQQRDREQHIPHAPIERLSTEGEVQTQAAVHPSRGQQAELHPLRIRNPQIGDDAGIVRRQAEHVVGEPRIGEMIDQNDRQREAERNTQKLGRRQTEGTPLIDRPQCQEKVEGRSAIKEQRARRAGPELAGEFEGFFRNGEGYETERMIDQVRGDIEEEHQAGGHSQLPANQAEREMREEPLAPRQPEVDRSRQRHLQPTRART